jgi:hypothetical protein
VIFVEASRKLAERAMLESGESPEARLRHLFQLVISREPNANELDILLESWKAHRVRFAGNPKAAEELLSTGESSRDLELDPIAHAAFTVVANLIMNLDEAVTRE